MIKIDKKFLLPFIDKSFSFSPKNEYKLAAERSEAACSGLRISNWRCILKIARTEFFPRPPAAGSGREGGKLMRLRREHSKLPKNLKINRLELYFVRAKEIFSSIQIIF
ncbi:hypothetical protein KJ853_01640 [Patescibacteria group bacterium]|nr:hypothetical protein [Patescibacteria group bacterium]